METRSLILDNLEGHIFRNNTLLQYLVAGCAVLLSFCVLYIFQRFVIAKLKVMSSKTTTTRDDMVVMSIEKIPHSVYLFISIFIGAKILLIPHWLDQIIYALFVIVVISQVGSMLIRVIVGSLNTFYFHQEGSNTTSHLIKIILKVIVWTLVLLLILNNLGVAITPLLTSLGVFGIAIAFALQNILEDLFSSISIYLDKPFQIGDYIELGAMSGTVSSLGIKTTRIKTIRGEEVVVANRTLTNETISNYGVMDHRTITTDIHVVYETSAKKLELIPTLIQELFTDREHTELKRVHLTSLGDSSIVYTYRYTIFSQDYELYLNVQQNVYLDLIKLFRKHKIEFAYPTQKLFFS